MLNLNSILLSSPDPKALTDFYLKVLDREKPDMDMGGYTGFLVGSTFLTIGPHDKVIGKSKEPERLIFNFETPEVEEEFERLKEFSEVIAKPYSMGEDKTSKIATLADPDGNYFQLLSPWKPEPAS